MVRRRRRVVGSFCSMLFLLVSLSVRKFVLTNVASEFSGITRANVGGRNWHIEEKIKVEEKIDQVKVVHFGRSWTWRSSYLNRF